MIKIPHKARSISEGHLIAIIVGGVSFVLAMLLLDKRFEFNHKPYKVHDLSPHNIIFYLNFVNGRSLYQLGSSPNLGL